MNRHLKAWRLKGGGLDHRLPPPRLKRRAKAAGMEINGAAIRKKY